MVCLDTRIEGTPGSMVKITRPTPRLGTQKILLTFLNVGSGFL